MKRFTRAQLEAMGGTELRALCKEMAEKEPDNKELKNVKNKKESQLIRGILNFEERRVDYPLTIINKDKKVNHLFHISDVHIYPLIRHNEYRAIFSKVYSVIEGSGLGKESLVVITGDLIHEKDNMKSENFILARDFLEKLANLTLGVVIIAGNHDFISKNSNRLDSITALVDRLGNNNIYYLKSSGIYQIGNDILFVVSSLIDSKFIWNKQVKKYNNQKTISLFHGMVDGAMLNEKMVVDEGFGTRNRSYFDGFDLVLLGDIHKHQFIKENMAYAGSLIQQNWGENYEGHGLILWNVNTGKGRFIEIENEYGYVNIDIRISQKEEFEFHTRSKSMPKMPRIRYHLYEPYSSGAFEKAKKEFERPYNVQYVSTFPHFIKKGNEILIGDGDKVYKKCDELQLVREVLSENIKNEDDMKFIIDFHKQLFHNELRKLNEQKDKEELWKVKRLEFRNILSYGGDKINVIDFDEKTGATSISGANTLGKSNILKILLYSLFKRTNMSNVSHNIVNRHTPKKAYIKLDIASNNYIYRITREIFSGKEHGKDADKSKKLDFEKFNLKGASLGNLNQITDTQTQQKIVETFGTYHSFLTHNVYSNAYRSNFIEMIPSDKLRELRDVFNLGDYELVRCEVEKIIKIINEKIAFIRGSLCAYKGPQSSGSSSNNKDEELREVIERKERINMKINGMRVLIDEIKENIKEERWKFEDLIEKSSGFSLEELEQLSLKWKDKVEERIVQNNKEFIKKRLAELEDVENIEDIEESKRDIENLKGKIIKINNEKLMTFEEAEQVIKLNNVKLLTNKSEEEIRNELERLEDEKDYITETLSRINEWRARKVGKNAKEADNIFQYIEKVIVNGDIFKSNERKRLEANLNWIQYHSAVNVICMKLIREIELEIEKYELKKELDTEEQKRYLVLVGQEPFFKKKEELRKIIEQKEGKLKEQNDQLNELEKEYSLIEEKEKEIKQSQIQLNRTNKIIAQLEERVVQMERKMKLYQIYSMKLKVGIPTSILKQRVKEVEYCANNVLQKFTEYQISFSLDEGTKTSSVGLDIIKEGNRLSVYDISGFETFILNIVFRLALHKCAEHQKSSVFFIDEGLDCLDNSNFSRLGELVEILKEEFNNVFLISHIKEIDEFTDNSLEIIKEDSGGSFIAS